MMKLEITAYPTDPIMPPPPPPPPEPESPIDPKLLAIMKKYKYNWRLSMLARPRHPEPKYVRPPDYIPQGGKFILLDPEMDFRCNHLARKTLRYLVITKKENEKVLGPRFIKIMNKNIAESWNSIYNYYKKKFMMRRKQRKAMRAKLMEPKLKKKKALDAKRKVESSIRLSKPKRIFLPAKMPHKWKPLAKLIKSVNKLAMPKEYTIYPPIDPTKVSPTALTYEITEVTLHLAQTWPYRYRVPLPPPLVPGSVQRGALKAKVTPRIEELATPVVNEQVKQNEEKADAWTISPTALKYKATPRIIELAKPRERD